MNITLLKLNGTGTNGRRIDVLRLDYLVNTKNPMLRSESLFEVLQLDIRFLAKRKKNSKKKYTNLFSKNIITSRFRTVHLNLIETVVG